MAATAPTQTRPLQLGDVVTRTTSEFGHSWTDRGVVVELNGPGTLGPRQATIAATLGYRGSTYYSSANVGTAPGEWDLVRYEEQTWEERIRARACRWEPPTWREPDEPVHDQETFGWALFEVFVTHLRPESEDGGDWPTDWLELAVDYARRLDAGADPEPDRHQRGLALAGELERFAADLRARSV